MPDLAPGSRLLCLGGDPSLSTLLGKWLEPFGWDCDHLPDPSLLLPDSAPSASLILLDHSVAQERKAAWVKDIRGQDGPPGNVPILLAAPAGSASINGVSALLPVPPDHDATLAIIANWSGPLADHAFRDLANPLYRLVRLGGQATANGLITRFAGQLEEAMTYLDRPDPASRVPHHIAGLAGMLGFHDIGQLWRAIDQGEAIDLSVVRDSTGALLDEIARRRLPG